MSVIMTVLCSSSIVAYAVEPMDMPPAVNESTEAAIDQLFEELVHLRMGYMDGSTVTKKRCSGYL